MNIKLFRLLTSPRRGISIVRVKNINRFLKLSDKIKLAEEIPTDPKDVFRIPPTLSAGGRFEVGRSLGAGERRYYQK